MFGGGSLPEDGIDYDELPVGIFVTHLPNPVRARRGGRSGSAFTWQFATSVQTRGERLEMLEFGAMTLTETGWVLTTYTGKPFTANDFAEWYNCPDAVLLPNHAYTDPLNWQGANRLLGRRPVKWYYVAKTSDGKLVRGESLVEALPEIDPGRNEEDRKGNARV